MVHLFIIPLVAALLWWYLCKELELTPKLLQLGFFWIIGLSAGLALFLWLMIVVTH